jgi:hypothetical protein
MEFREFCRFSYKSLFPDFFSEIVPIEKSYIEWDDEKREYGSREKVEEKECETIGHK